MSQEDYKTYPGTLFDFRCGVYAGVLITERVMRKLGAVQAKYLEDVKRVLTDEAERGNVFPSGWNLYYPDGKQTVLKYIDESRDVANSIRTATISPQPEPHFLVFIASSMDEAQIMAEARHASLNPKED